MVYLSPGFPFASGLFEGGFFLFHSSSVVFLGANCCSLMRVFSSCTSCRLGGYLRLSWVLEALPMVEDKPPWGFHSIIYGFPLQSFIFLSLESPSNPGQQAQGFLYSFLGTAPHIYLQQLLVEWKNKFLIILQTHWLEKTSRSIVESTPEGKCLPTPQVTKLTSLFDMEVSLQDLGNSHPVVVVSRGIFSSGKDTKLPFLSIPSPFKLHKWSRALPTLSISHGGVGVSVGVPSGSLLTSQGFDAQAGPLDSIPTRSTRFPSVLVLPLGFFQWYFKD